MFKLLPLILSLLLYSCYYGSTQHFLKYQNDGSIEIPKQWIEEDVIILEDSLSIIVEHKDESNVIIEEHVSYYYVNNATNEDLKVISFFEDSEVEELPQFKVSALFPNGETWIATYYDFKSIPHSYNGEYLTDDIIHLVEIPTYSKGTIIRVVEKRNLIMPEFCTSKFMRAEYPILNKRVQLTYDSKCKWNYRVSNNENLKIDTVHTFTNEGLKKLSISSDTLESLPDNEVPHPEEWFCGLHLSIPHKGQVSHSWKSIGDYFLSIVYKNQEENSAALSNFIAKSDINKNSDTEKIISQAFSYIQNNIRYYANMEDDHSYIPRSIPEILSKGYGDCKEMSVLLQGILHRLGVKTGLALVGTEGSIQYIDDIPTLSAFNHIIVYRKDQNGNIIYYDPTVDYGKSSNSYMNLIGQKTLLIKKGKSEPGVVKRTLDHKNLFYTKSKIIKDTDADKWILSGTISLTGEAAYTIFPYMKNLDKEEIKPFLKGFLKRFFDFNSNSAIIDSSSDEFCRIKFEADFQSNFIKLENGGFRLSAPSLFGGNFRYTTQSREGPRKFKQMQQIDEWILPKGFSDLESKSLKTSFASGNWNFHSGIATRSYSSNDVIFSSHNRKEESNYFKQKKKFVKAIVWK